MKTWEVIRDIKQGEIYTITAPKNWAGGKLYFKKGFMSFATPVLVLEDDEDGTVDLFGLNTQTLNYEWVKKLQWGAPVNFFTAWDKYECGWTVKSLDSNKEYAKGKVSDPTFTFDEIRSDWLVLE